MFGKKPFIYTYSEKTNCHIFNPHHNSTSDTHMCIMYMKKTNQMCMDKKLIQHYFMCSDSLFVTVFLFLPAGTLGQQESCSTQR